LTKTPPDAEDLTQAASEEEAEAEAEAEDRRADA